MAYFRCSSGSSGGGGTSGKTTSPATASATFTIDTGIADLKKFFVHTYSNGTSYGVAMQCSLMFDKETSATKYYSSAMYHPSGGGAGGESFYEAFSSTAKDRNLVIVSISNGVVTIKNPSQASYCNHTVFWIAE